MAGFINSWSVTAADNATADSTINFAEGQLPGTLNNSCRALMSSIVSWVKDQGATGSVSGGSANAYTLSLNCAFTSFATGQMATLRPGATNTTASTLNVNSLGAKALRKYTAAGDSALGAGDLRSGGLYQLIYDAAGNSAAGAWMVLNPTIGALTGPISITSSTGLTLGPSASSLSHPLGGSVFTGASATGTNTFGNLVAYGTTNLPGFVCYHARGTQAAPTAVKNNDYLGIFSGIGYNDTTGWGLGGAQICLYATEDYTSTNQGGRVDIQVCTPDVTADVVTTARFDHDGTLTLGRSVATLAVPVTTLTSPLTSAVILAAMGTNVNTFCELHSYGTGLPGYVTFSARGTQAAPTATQNGDILGVMEFSGRGATGWGTAAGGQFRVTARQTWTDAAQGADVSVYATANGTTAVAEVARFATTLITFNAALNYGGVSLSNAVTGTGNMVLSASPTLTGTLAAAAGTFSSTLAATGKASIGSSASAVCQLTAKAGSIAVPATSGTAQASGALRLESVGGTGVLDIGIFGGTYQWLQSCDSANLATNYALALNPNGGAVNIGVGGLSPLASDGAALGTTALMWSDLFAASGAVLNFNNGNVTLTHGNTGGNLSFATGVSGGQFTAQNTNAASTANGFIVGDSSGNNTIALGNNNSTDETYVWNFRNSRMKFATNSTQRMSIEAIGNVVIGTGALATNATDGFLYIPTCAGAPTGNSTDYTGCLPMVFDTTNSKLWFNTSTTTWKGIVLA